VKDTRVRNTLDVMLKTRQNCHLKYTLNSKYKIRNKLGKFVFKSFIRGNEQLIAYSFLPVEEKRHTK